MSGDFAGLEKFFRERIKKYPQEPANYFMLIEASFRHPALNRTAPAIAREYFKKFPENSTEINAICWSLLNQLPYSAEAFAAVCAGEKLLQNAKAANESRILVTRSLIAYRKCDLKMANHYAKKAQSAARNTTDKAFINELLKYYQAVKK
jgi:mannitol-1-phosphate/altronate dehydrogenase